MKSGTESITAKERQITLYSKGLNKIMHYKIFKREISFSCDIRSFNHLIPFLWSNAGIMEAGCSDIKATNNWSTSWIFSSWGGEKDE